MKHTIHSVKVIVLTAFVMISFFACQKNDSKPTPRVEKYSISAFPGYNISGSATFKEILNSDSVMLTIRLQGKDVTNLTSFPVFIREGTSLENGKVKFEIGNYDGSKSSLEKDIPVSYDDLTGMNASISIYRNQSDLKTVIGQGELGSNKFYQPYTLYNPINLSMVQGQFRVYKRSAGTYLVIKTNLEDLDSLCIGHPHPAGVFKADGYPDTNFDLNPVADSSGISSTSLPNHSFDEMIHYDGSIKVVCSETVQVPLAQGKFK